MADHSSSSACAVISGPSSRLAFREQRGEAIQVLGPAVPVLVGVVLFLRVGPGEQLVAALDHAKTGPFVALGCQRELDEHRVADHRLLSARRVPTEREASGTIT